METYEKEIYQFLTQKDNYRQMLKVLEHQDMIWENLIIEFWDLVIEKLEKLNEENSTKWEIKADEEYFDPWSSLNMIKKEWPEYRDNGFPAICVAWESLSNDLHYGIWIRKEFWDNPELRNIIASMQKEKGNKGKSTWILFYGQGYNFSRMEDLVHILPDNRDDLATEFATMLFDLAAEMEGRLDEIIERIKA